MTLEFGFSFDQEKCIQCHGCEMACKSWRHLEVGLSWRQVKPVWRGVYPQIKNLSLSLACMHCHDPKCLAICPEDAISKRSEDGIVVVDQELCTGCQSCHTVCPIHIPQFGANGKMQKCDLCYEELDLKKYAPPCVASCPTGALCLTDVGDEKKAEEQRLLALMNQ